MTELNGRPKIYPEGTTMVSIDVATKRELKAEARSQGISQTEQIRRIWRVYKHLKASGLSLPENFFSDEGHA